MSTLKGSDDIVYGDIELGTIFEYTWETTSIIFVCTDVISNDLKILRYTLSTNVALIGLTYPLNKHKFSHYFRGYIKLL